ncbi:MAG: tRNA (adenosine(37)-N6)-threonylcarbamoyltransferase complex transferase subunit TsaD [Candidatus Magasanikbacteria bacterium]
MIILGIESSCDDTSVALLDITDAPTPLNPPFPTRGRDRQGSGETIKILAEKTANQIEIHKKYGGVVPEIAGRLHAEKILPVVEEVMKNQPKPDVIAVTSGPGLITGLLVGVETAKTLSYLWNVPIVSVNHIEGHIHSVQVKSRTQGASVFSEKSKVKSLRYPILSLVASGGHSEIILSTEEGKYERVGGTRDDAAGECFDKVAKLLGFDYPGGPKISKFAETGNPKAIKFPRPMINSKNFDFSFSGLKTSALYWLHDHKLSAMHTSPIQQPAGIFGIQKEEITINDFCASFEQAIVDLLVFKTLKAIKKYQPKTVILGGGVSANKKLRETLKSEIKLQSPNSLFLIPYSLYSMDNATMIAVAAYHHAKNKNFTNWQDLQANPNWKVYEKNT